MKQLLNLIVCIAAWFASGALAQNWTLFVPPEGDFRVLLPATPSRHNAPGGGVEFRVEGGEQKYYIFRHNPGAATTIEQARAISAQRVTDDDSRTRRVRQQTPDLAPNEYEFRVARNHYIHRVIFDGGRYYELVAQVHEEEGLHLPSVRDFFNSFQLGLGMGRGFAVLRNIPTPDTCQARPNAYARRFCEYLTCLAPGQEANPICTALPRLRLQ